MRTEPNRRKINRLYILGAGASYSVTEKQNSARIAPLDYQFCERIASLNSVKRPAWVSEVALRIKNEYLHHIDFHTSGLEELIRQQLSDYEFINSLHPRRAKGKRDSDKYLHDIVHLVAYVLSKARAKDHKTLENWLKKSFMGKGKNKDRVNHLSLIHI